MRRASASPVLRLRSALRAALRSGRTGVLVLAIGCSGPPTAATGGNGAGGPATDTDPAATAAPACVDEPAAPQLTDPGTPVGAPALGYPAWLAELADDKPSVDAIRAAAAGVCDDPQFPTDAQALAGLHKGVALCCERPVAEDAAFVVGCRMAASCTVRVPSGGGHASARTADELAAALAPIDSRAEALGLVALIHRDVWLPLGEDTQTVAGETAQMFKWHPYPDAPPIVEVTEHAWGYLVRASLARTCGCEHSLVRRTFRVDRDGSVCATSEPAQPIAYSAAGLCID